MNNFKRNNSLFSMCRLNCGLCTMRLGGHCPGCGQGNKPCKIARCGMEQGVEYYFQCPEYPCELYDHVDEYDSFMTYLHQKADLMKAKEIGIEAYTEEQSEKYKMTAEPFYHGIINSEIKEFPLKAGKLRLIAGSYEGYSGIQGKYLPLDYYDIFLDPHGSVTLNVPGENKSAMVFTLEGAAAVSQTLVPAKTAAKLGKGDTVVIKAGDEPIEILFMCSDTLNEPVAWFGPVVMNTREELLEAFNEMANGKFIKQEAKYENIDPFYSESNMARLNESEQQYRDGRVVVKTMKDLEAMADE